MRSHSAQQPTTHRSMKYFFMLLILLCACMAHTKKRPGDIIIPYPFANDSFLIRTTDLAEMATKLDTVRFVYYADESLKSGKETGRMIERFQSSLTAKKYVFVGIAHFGYFRSKRRRDFISPSVESDKGYVGKNENYGQADAFYSLLKDKIVPAAEEKYRGYVIERSFMGHSLGGLFASYLLVNGDTLFHNLYALSPSLWIDDYHILDYESAKQESLKNIDKNFWISCGSAETFNKIKTSVNKMSDTLDKRKYPAVRYKVKVYDGETHNSAVSPALEEIFTGF